MAERLFRRLGHHYILVMMVLTRLFGAAGGLLVIYYMELTQKLPHPVRLHFWVICVVVVAIAIAISLSLAMWETRNLRPVLRRLRQREAVDLAQSLKAGREAVTLPARHHRHEAWLVPCTTYIPTIILLKVLDDIPFAVIENITATCFMAIAMALMSHFFATDRCIQPVIRYLLDHGVSIDYKSLPVGKLRFRMNLCFILMIMTTALMIGTLARQRTADIIRKPGGGRRQPPRALDVHHPRGGPYGDSLLHGLGQVGGFPRQHAGPGHGACPGREFVAARATDRQ